MKFTYTYITKEYTEITEYKVNKNNKVDTNKIRIVLDNINVKKINMYEVLEHWKEYQRKKRELEKLDKLINKLVTKNGTTKY